MDPESGPSMSEGAMTRLRQGIQFDYFSVNPTHPSRIWQVPIELWHKQTMYEHAAYFHLGRLRLGQVYQEGGQLPRDQNWPTAKSICFAWQRLLWKKNGPIRDVSEAAMILLEIHSELRLCEFDVTFTAICEETGTKKFKLALTI